MALGGGNWLTQDKVLPGTYINYISAVRTSASLAERGYVAVPMHLDWGVEEEIITVDSADFFKNSLKLFALSSTEPLLKPVREILKGAKTLYTYRVNSGGKKATAIIDDLTVEAKYTGTLGNRIKMIITDLANNTFNVVTMVENAIVDEQIVSEIEQLANNDFVVFSGTGVLTATAGITLEGGTSGEESLESYTRFLELLESRYINILAYAGTDEQIKSLFADFTKRMRNEYGVKFQTVLHKYNKADFEGIISVENNVVANGDSMVEISDLVYWVAGKSAGCPINRSLSNAKYDGELKMDVDYTQSELEDALKNGKFIFHRVGDEVRVLSDINTFTSFESGKNEDFSLNQVIRVLDQDAIDTATVFNNRYSGKIQNAQSGRIALWEELVTLAEKYQRIGAIEAFVADDVVVEQGNEKRSVVVTKYIQPMSAMEKLYVTVIVE